MTTLAPPHEVGPSAWDHTPYELPADGQSPVAVGGDLDPATMVGAYRRGLFPWPAIDGLAAARLRRQFATPVADGRIPSLSGSGPATLDLPWWSPDPRGVVPAGGVHVSRTLRWRLRSSGWTATVDEAFGEVVRHCCRGGPNEWITVDLVAAYDRLHELGWAHSFEVWADDVLLGGHFGLVVGGVYACESMFHLRTDASKVAFVDFDARFAAAGGRLIDVQLASPHLTTLGAVEMPRPEYLRTLVAERDRHVGLVTDPLPVLRLA